MSSRLLKCRSRRPMTLLVLIVSGMWSLLNYRHSANPVAVSQQILATLALFTQSSYAYSFINSTGLMACPWRPTWQGPSMSDPWFQSLFAERIGGVNYGKGTEIYKFEKIKRAKRKAIADHPERKLLDFGIG